VVYQLPGINQTLPMMFINPEFAMSNIDLDYSNIANEIIAHD